MVAVRNIKKENTIHLVCMKESEVAGRGGHSLWSDGSIY